MEWTILWTAGGLWEVIDHGTFLGFREPATKESSRRVCNGKAGESDLMEGKEAS